MGQYHKIVNLDKKQYLHPHRFDDGLKLMEFGQSGSGTLLGLTILLSCSNGRGGGDFRGDSDLVGTWAGDRIAIIGDYGEAGDLPAEFDAEHLYSACDDGGEYEDISDAVVGALKEAGEWLRGEESRF